MGYFASAYARRFGVRQRGTRDTRRQGVTLAVLAGGPSALRSLARWARALGKIQRGGFCVTFWRQNLLWHASGARAKGKNRELAAVNQIKVLRDPANLRKESAQCSLSTEGLSSEAFVAFSALQADHKSIPLQACSCPREVCRAGRPRPSSARRAGRRRMQAGLLPQRRWRCSVAAA